MIKMENYIYVQTGHNSFVHINLSGKGYNHKETTKQKHEKKISCPSSKRALLKHPAVAICKYHVEQEVEANRTKIQKTCDQPPELKKKKEKKNSGHQISCLL